MACSSSNLHIGIVSTMKGPEFTLESWLLWHGSLGIRHFYIFFDDPLDSAITIAERYQQIYNVRIFKNDGPTCELKKSAASYESLKHILDTEVPARQQLNADYALTFASQDGVEWLLHLDADELFYLTPPLTLQEHFAKLSRDRVGTIVYMNHEGVPESSDQIGDFFHHVSLFRRNFNALQFTSQSQRAVDFWRARTAHHQYMISYDNGKAATRVVPGAHAAGVHAWKISDDKTNPSGLRNVSSLADVRTLDLSKLYKCTDVFILHFVVCGLHWYLKKYKILDAFPNAWFGGQLTIHPCFHLDSRNRFLKGDFEAFRQAYRNEVVIDDPAVVESQIESGVCMRVTGISDAIKAHYSELFNRNFEPVSSVIATSDQMQRTSTALPTASEFSSIQEDHSGAAVSSISPKTDKESSTSNICGNASAETVPNEAAKETLTLEKMWVLSSLVSQYLTPGEGNTQDN